MISPLTQNLVTLRSIPRRVDFKGILKCLTKALQGTSFIIHVQNGVAAIVD